MIDIPQHISLFIFIIGILIAASMWIKTVAERALFSPLTGYLLLGILLRAFGDTFQLFTETTYQYLELLGEIGLILLLFKAGMESHFESLLSHINQSSFIAVVEIIGSGLFGFSASFYLLGFSFIPSLFAGVAFTATSIGVSVGIFEGVGAMQRSEAKLLLALATLDDIAGIALMALLFELAPVIHEQGDLLPTVVKTTGIFILQFTLFSLFCYLFSTYIEPRLMKLLDRFEKQPDRLITVATNALIIASLSAFLGFSLAIGAFFAGLAFSHDKEIKNMRPGFGTLEDFFVPFFFINIGFMISLGSITKPLLIMTLILVIAAAAGKFIFVAFPSMLTHLKRKSAALLGLSMIPRAEMTMVIMQQGALLGAWAVPPSLYDSVILVVLFTSLIPPLIVMPLLRRA